MSNNLLKNIEFLCEFNKITVAKLERDCDLGNGTIRRWGISSPSVDKVLNVSNYFKISVEDLIYLKLDYDTMKNKEFYYKYFINDILKLIEDYKLNK